MDLKYIEDENFKNSAFYDEFLRDNPGKGNLKIRAFAANEAVPIEGLRVIISTVKDNVKMIFFDGNTDASGMINTISLPVPAVNLDNLEIPSGIIYDVESIDKNNNRQLFKVLMYDGICVVQNIVAFPDWGNI